MATLDIRKKMRVLARELVRSLRSRQPNIGFTVIVHTNKPSRGKWPMVLETTLETAAEYRALLADALTTSVLLDGGKLSNVKDVATRDYAQVMGKCPSDA